MKKVEDYRPATIEFTATSKQVPQSLGKFKTDDEARLFMAQNLLAIQTKLTATRKIDAIEKQMLRDQYTSELENDLPTYRDAYGDALYHLEEMKKKVKDAQEMMNASLTKIQQLADEANDGTTDIELDPAHTWETAHNGKRFYYSYMDGEIKLAKVLDIPSHESDDLISSSEKNGQFFAKFLKVKGEKVG